MVHCALGRVGYVIGGPATLIRALLDVLGPEGTLVMPAESPQAADPAAWNDPRVLAEWHATIREHLPEFDALTTPTTMGALAEAFRTFPGTLRSNHPLVSVCANGAAAAPITAEHSLEFCEGRGTPFEKLYDQDASVLLLGVGFNRCTTLHYAESLVPARRTTISRYPLLEGGVRRWVEKPDMASDRGEHFPEVGRRFFAQGQVRVGRIGAADCMLFSNRKLVDFAREYFLAVLR
jgi:aminoglycoside 3-N-acetyltransferase